MVPRSCAVNGQPVLGLLIVLSLNNSRPAACAATAILFRVTRSFGPDEHGRIILDGVVEQGEPEPGQLVAVELIGGDVKMTQIDAVEGRDPAPRLSRVRREVLEWRISGSVRAAARRAWSEFNSAQAAGSPSIHREPSRSQPSARSSVGAGAPAEWFGR
jgi:hypothetical protein